MTGTAEFGVLASSEKSRKTFLAGLWPRGMLVVYRPPFSPGFCLPNWTYDLQVLHVRLEMWDGKEEVGTLVNCHCGTMNFDYKVSAARL